MEKHLNPKGVKVTYLTGSKELEAGYIFGDLLKIDDSFSLKSSDFKIKVPQLLQPGKRALPSSLNSKVRLIWN